MDSKIAEIRGLATQVDEATNALYKARKNLKNSIDRGDDDDDQKSYMLVADQALENRDVLKNRLIDVSKDFDMKDYDKIEKNAKVILDKIYNLRARVPRFTIYENYEFVKFVIRIGPRIIWGKLSR